jgi:membrane protein involved in colicin uptake
MNRQRASRAAAVLLFGLLPVCAYAVQAGGAAGHPTASVEEMDLEAVGERIRQTGAQMQADLRKARARLEAQKAHQEAVRKREAELARQQAIKEEAEQAALRQRKEQEAAQRQAEAARKAAIVAQRAKEEQAAKAKAAKALEEARKSAGEKAFSDE